MERAHKHTHSTTPARISGLKAKTPSQTDAPQTPPRIGGVQAEHPYTYKRTHPKTPVRNGGAQPKPKPKHTHKHRTPQPGMAGNRRRAHTNTHI